ncbi:transposase [Gaoshiqia sp. Z1-71]|uniref:transposase n=1 Tax=Gaoshiqia hydrogeniformans TaxID=3290090 RepID=UPI003BF7AD8D
MEKKAFYRRTLPHFQQPGQAYFVSWNLKDAIPPKALTRYVKKIDELKAQIVFQKEQKTDKKIIEELETNYYSIRKKYIKAYDDLLNLGENLTIDLSEQENLKIIKEALHFWEGKKLENFAYAVMCNHVHWVFGVYKEDENKGLVYLQDIMQSVKRETSNRINKREKRTGPMWQKESFDITIRDDKHLYYAINYTLQNPVSAGLVSDWREWPGCWCGCAGF